MKKRGKTFKMISLDDYRKGRDEYINRAMKRHPASGVPQDYKKKENKNGKAK